MYVAHYRFVTLDTTSKEEMVNVMLELRSKTFVSGEPVKARLKSAVVLNADVSPVTFPLANGGASTLYAPLVQGGTKKSSNGNRKKKNSANNKSKNSNTQNKASKGGKEDQDGNGDSSRRINSNVSSILKGKKNGSPRQETGSKQTKGSKQAAPTLGEDHFPALPSDDMMNKNKVEVEKLPEESMDSDTKEARRSSDSASTATTSSSSSSSKNTGSGQQSLGGYAAALLKPAPLVTATPTEKPKSLSNTAPSLAKKMANTNGDKMVQSNQKSIQGTPSKQNKHENAAAEPMKKVQAPVWGGGRSFADVLRKEASAALVHQQSA